MTAAAFEEAVRRHALTLPEAYEDRPWGHPVFKLPPNKVFVFMSEGEEPVRVTVKLDAEEREAALTQPFIGVAKYVGRYGWVTVDVIDDDALTMVLDWVAESWWLKAETPRSGRFWSHEAAARRILTAMQRYASIASAFAFGYFFGLGLLTSAGRRTTSRGVSTRGAARWPGSVPSRPQLPGLSGNAAPNAAMRVLYLAFYFPPASGAACSVRCDGAAPPRPRHRRRGAGADRPQLARRGPGAPGALPDACGCTASASAGPATGCSRATHAAAQATARGARASAAGHRGGCCCPTSSRCG